MIRPRTVTVDHARRQRPVTWVLLTSLVFALAAARSAGAQTGAAQTGAGRPAALAQTEGPCAIQLQRDVPAQAVVDQPFPVAITVKADCAGAALPMHLAVVVDNTINVGGPRMEGLKNGVRALFDAIDLSQSQAGLAVFNAKVDFLVPLGRDRDALKAAVESFYPRTGSRVDLAVRAGHQMLKNARGTGAPGVQEILLLVSGGPDEDGPDVPLAEAAKAKDDGVLIVTVAAASAADYDMLTRMATSPAFFYTETIAGRYPGLFQQIVKDLSQVKLMGGLVTDTLATGFEYSWGSGIPAPRLRGRDLTWLYAVWPEGGLEISYQAICKQLGRFPSSDGATAELTFDRGSPYVYALPVAAIDCVPPPTATATPSATPTATVTPSASPSPRPTEPLRPVYLPFLGRRHCKPTDHRADVVLLLDASSSMHEPAAGGEIKLQLALDAGTAFIDSLTFPGDRAAVVAFSGRSEVLMGLSDNRLGLLMALADIFGHVRVGSRLDQGLAAAQALLAGGGPGRVPVVVLLTDGLADPPSALAAAARARAAGLTVFAIGLGEGADAALLQQLAGSPDRFFPSPDGADLERIFRTVAIMAGCDGG